MPRAREVSSSRRAVRWALFLLPSLSLAACGPDLPPNGSEQGGAPATSSPDGAGGSSGARASATTGEAGATGISSSTSGGGDASSAGGGGGDVASTASAGSGGGTTSGHGGSGGSGGDPGTGNGGGGGISTECENVVDCDDENPCTADACEGGPCLHVDVADGEIDADPADCMRFECIRGALETSFDDDETPPSPDPPCVLAECVSGVAIDVLADNGTECGPSGEGHFCDEGICVGCTGDVADECGQATPCAAPACNTATSECEPHFIPAGAAPTGQTPGDCQAVTCSGSSASPGSAPDNADPPADTPCGDGVCSSGVPTQVTLTEGSACRASEVGFCDGAGIAAGSCRNCRSTTAIPDPGCNSTSPVCNEASNAGEGACVKCIDTAGGAGIDDGCSSGTPICSGGVCGACLDTATGTDDDLGCPGNLVCDASPLPGVCNTCAPRTGIDDGCPPDKPVCSTGGSTCYECNTNSDCNSSEFGPRCNNHFCVCTTDSDCTPLECTGNPGFCF